MTSKLRLAYYGDDFTGSTDVMEVLTWAGLPTVLFIEPPDQASLDRFPGIRAAGFAGESRGRSPEWMSAELPAIFRRLRGLDAEMFQYKVCSTFDSSPAVGSIGRALEIGLEVFGGSWAPLVVGAPRLDRYQAFGNLFATVAGETHRLDRHPTMSRHPVTPMLEADLRRHLAEQTALGIGLVDLLALRSGRARRRLDAEVARGARAVFLDVIDDEGLERVGELVWEGRAEAPFSVSSSGLEYALVSHWRARGELGEPAAPEPPREVERVAVFSGSCSPETAASIRWAIANGWRGVRLDARDSAGDAVEKALAEAVGAAAESRSFVVYTALGPDDEAVAADDAARRERIGDQLARLARAALRRTGIRRAVICGGDTSSRVGRGLGVEALTAVRPLTPGSPLCRAWSRGPLDGLEIVLKGGQRGGPRFFDEVRRGLSA